MANIAVPWSLAGILFIIVIILFLNPDKAQIWSSVISGKLASTNNYFKRKSISGKLQGKVNQFAKKMDKESNGIMPYQLKVEWISNVDREALLQGDGTIIVRLGHQHNDIQKALALAMQTFSSKAVIPNSRPYLPESVVRSIDMVTTKKMLHSTNEGGSLDYFLDEIVTPAVNENEDLREKCQTMEFLDERGLFSRVLLREYKEMGRKMYPRTPDGSTLGESEEFLNFLKAIAALAPGEEGNLDFKKDRIKVAVMPIARAEVVEHRGSAAYIRRIEKLRKDKMETVYLLGLGDNVNYVRKTAAQAEQCGLASIVNTNVCKIRSYQGRAIDSICISLDMIPEEQEQ